MFSSRSTFWGGGGNSRESEANPVEVNLDDWIMTCGGMQNCLGGAGSGTSDSNGGVRSGDGGAGGGDCDGFTAACKDVLMISNSNNKTNANNGNSSQMSSASSHRGQSTVSNNIANENCIAPNNVSVNEVSAALQAYAENRRRAAELKMMHDDNNNTNPSCLDMATRINHSFTKDRSYAREELDYPEDEVKNTNTTNNNSTSLRMEDLINRHQHHRNCVERQIQNNSVSVIDPKALNISKTDSILSIHTDSESSSSACGGDDDSTNVDECDEDKTLLGGFRSSRWWILVCIMLSLILIGVGMGVGLSMKNNNSKDNNKSVAGGDNNVVDSGSDASQSGDSSVNANNTDGGGSSSSVNANNTDGGGEVTIGPDDWASAITAVPGTLDGLNNDIGGYDYRSNTKYLVGVYYYPWHGDGNFHNNEGYIRSELIPPHQPELGEYNDSDPNVIAAHMNYFRQANIGLLVTSWWGPNRMEDTTTRNVIMDHVDVGNLQVALHYETSGRIRGTLNEGLAIVRQDMQYICETYFDHPNYYKIDGRPVLVIYVSRALSNDGQLEEVLLTMRSEVSKCGHNVYLIGDQVFAKAPDTTNEPFIPFWYFDAVTNYDVYGSANKPTPYALRERVDNFYNEQQKWRELAMQENCRFIPPVSPGYNDRGVRLAADHPPLSRRLDENSEEGSLFWYQLKRALPLVDPQADNMILVNSFNEWHEDTQIEPAIGEPATEPFNLTSGLTYVGYGDLYLDILRAATTDGQEDFFDFLLA